MPTGYLETTVVSYLTARTSRDEIVRGHQKATVEWWEHHRHRVDLVTSNAVFEEAAGGIPKEAAKRLRALSGMKVLAVDDAAIRLAKRILEKRTIPHKASADALHLAIAAVNRVNFLVTWNCTHLANAFLRKKIEEVCDAAGFAAPIICTPEQLMQEM